MKYANVNVTGDAGEYYFAYFVTHTLGWPCRLLDIDIGIDAQVEILDDKSHSTGQFLAVQIKGTRDREKLSIDVAKKHVDYWLSIDIPVLLALVNVDRRTVYIKSIRVNGDDPSPNTSGENYKFRFNRSDLLSVSRIGELRLLAYATEIRCIEKILNSVNSKCSEIIEDCNMEEGIKVEDHEHYLDFISDIRDVGGQLFNCKELVLKVRSQVGDCGYAESYNLFMRARSDMSYLFDRADYMIYNPSEMKAFNEDYFALNSKLALDY